MNRRQWMIAPVTALALALALSSCGDRRAGEVNGSAGAVRELTAAEFGTQISGAQLKAQSGHIEGTVTRAGKTLHMSGDFSAGSSVDDIMMDMSMTAGVGKTMTFRLLDRVFYVKASGGLLTGDSGKPWVKIDLDDPDNPMGAWLDQMLSSLDPQRVEKLYASIKELKDLGMDQVDGVAARHYSVTVDTAQALKAMGLDNVPGVSAAELRAHLPATLTSQVWVDSHQRPVKITSTVSGTTTTFEYSAWGEPVKVNPPPAGQVGTPSLGSH